MCDHLNYNKTSWRLACHQSFANSQLKRVKVSSLPILFSKVAKTVVTDPIGSIGVPQDRGHISIKLGTIHVIYQKLAIFFRKRMSMLTGLKVSSSAYKCVFYRPEHNAKGGMRGTPWKWTLKFLKCKCEIYQRIEVKQYKNGVICLFTMFTLRVVSIKMSKLLIFLYFLLMIAKNQSRFGQNI